MTKRNITPENDLRFFLESAENGSEIVLSEGIYRLTAPAEIKDKHNITIRGNGAILTGSVVISGNAKPFRDGIFAIETEKNLDIQEIYVDGRKYIMARYPNYDPSKRLGGTSADAVERIAKSKNPAGGYLRALHSYEWGGNDYVIEGVDRDGKPILRWIGDNNRGSGYHPGYVMIENIFEELDSEKEWFYDKSDGLLYILPENGKSLENAVIEASVNGELLKFTDCSDIRLENVRFEKTKRMMFCSEYKKITRSDWAVAENGAVFMKNCENIALDGCAFENVGGNCVFISEKNRDIRITGCDFVSCGASGVCIFGDRSCVRDLSTWENHRTELADKTPGPCADRYPSDIRVESCWFYDLGIYEKQSAAVTLSVASGVTVKGCTAHHLPRAGFNVCDGSFGGHVFEDNLIFDTVLETGDHGPFNSWGRDRYWSLGGFDTGGNNGKAKRPFAMLDAVEPTVIRHNMIVGSGGFGIDLDDGSSNYLIENNLCRGVGIKLREGFLRTVRNNLLFGAPLDIHCAFTQSDDLIENNIVVNSKPTNPILCDHEGCTTVVRGNLFVDAEERYLKNELLGEYENFTSVHDADAEKGITSLIPFVPFSFEFGVSGKPKPILSSFSARKAEKTEKLGAVLSEVDDSVRSMAGLPDQNGAFVEEISDGVLFAAGVRKHDVILSVGGKTVVSPGDLPDEVANAEITVSRAQKLMTL